MSRVIKPPPEDLVEEFDFEQGGDEWFAAHIGIPTASVFRGIMSESRDGPDTGIRASLLRRFAAEIILGEPMETFSNSDMARGKEQEPALLAEYEAGLARKAFARREKAPQVRPIGFIRRTINDPLMTEPLVAGCSPDALVGDDGGVEIKSMRPDLIVRLLDSGRAFPSEHRWQCIGSMWVTGRKWWDLKIGYAGFPLAPEWRLEREPCELAIAMLRTEVEKFAWDLKKLVERVRAKGAK